MKTIIKNLTVALLCSQTAVFAATPMSGPYMRAFGGFASTPNTVNTTSFTAAEYRAGYNAGGQLGYKSGPIRYEVEGSYIYNKVKHFSFNGVQQTTTSGKAQASSLLVNLYYDFEDLNMSLAPYIGIGAGYAQVRTTLNSTAPSTSAFKQSQIVFAYKGLVGLNYNFSENISSDIGYQYFRTKKSTRLNSVFQTHLATLGLTYRFDN